MNKKPLDAKPKGTASLQRIRPPKLEEIKEDGLGSLKPNTTRHTSETKNSTIPRNVNFYRHLINDKYASENDIEWVLKLRSPAEGGSRAKLEQTSTQPFSFDGRALESQKLHHDTMDLDSKNQLHKVQHLFVRRLGATPSQGTVFFETGLRSYGASSERARALERNWKTASKKDRNDFPTMYPSYEETLKVRAWSTKNQDIKTHTAFDGNHNYPKFGDLEERQTRNVQDIRHILRAPGKLMATADWELSMRHYGENKKPREFYDQENAKKTLGTLKKVNRKVNRL